MRTERLLNGLRVGTQSLAIGLLLVLPCAGALAGIPETPVLSRADPVMPGELATMRGRFAQGGTIVHFGVEMVSRLRTASGQVLNGKLMVAADLRGTRPRLTFQPTASIEQAGDSDVTAAGTEPVARTSIRTDGSGAGSAIDSQGVLQTIQVAGSGNDANNALQISVTEGLPADLPDSATGGVDAVAHGTGGSLVRANGGRGGMTLDLHVPGVGSISQGIESRGVRQTIKLQGDRHQAASAARIRVYVRDRLSSASRALLNATGELRALR